ncbi:unnamed protein product, partial [Brassica rapa]
MVLRRRLINPLSILCLPLPSAFAGGEAFPVLCAIPDHGFEFRVLHWFVNSVYLRRSTFLRWSVGCFVRRSPFLSVQMLSHHCQGSFLCSPVFMC